jgi:hypothetical protein
MDVTGYNKLRTAVQQNAHPAGDMDALRLQQMLQESLRASGLFAQLEVGRTIDPDRLIIGLCQCADDVLPWEAAMGVERVWSSVSAGARWEAHHVGCTETLMEFEGSLTLEDTGQYLTVHLLAEPSTPVPSSTAPAQPLIASVPVTTD